MLAQIVHHMMHIPNVRSMTLRELIDTIFANQITPTMTNTYTDPTITTYSLLSFDEVHIYVQNTIRASEKVPEDSEEQWIKNWVIFMSKNPSKVYGDISYLTSIVDDMINLDDPWSKSL